VVFHLVEDRVFESYMNDLFMVSSKYVIINAWDVEGEIKYHVRQRNFSKWIENNIDCFELVERIKRDPENNFCDFFIYRRIM